MLWRLVKMPFLLLTALSKGMLATLFVLALALAFLSVSNNAVSGRMSDIVDAFSPDLSIRSQDARLLAAETNRADSEKNRADAAVAAAGDLKERNQTLSQNDDALNATNTALKQQGDTLTQANAALTAKVTALTAEAAKANVNYLGRTIPVAEAVADAAQRLADRAIKTAKRTTDAAPAEAMPVYGVPLIAAITGQNVQDTCAQLRDLQGLNSAFNPGQTLSDGGICGMTVPDANALWTAVHGDTLALWQRAQSLFAGLPALTLPDWWAPMLTEADTVLSPMPLVTVRP
ncbi:MAG: hypothetical protein KGH84_00075 [Paracoccaceae bacterium]|nr:hypothetical protein [Paracoccaceae bacterium]